MLASKMLAVVVLLLVLVAYCGVYADTRDITIVNNKLMVNNKEFIVKGLDYSPSPLGLASTNLGTGYGGTGLCSPKMTPWGEWKSACADSDYFDGSPDINPQRFPHGFQPLWQRDFPLIKQTGANTIRLYNINPSTRAATQTYTSLFPYPTGKDHTQFLKYCEANGLYVIYPLLSDNNLYNTLDEATFKRYLRWQIDEAGNSSSILMWQLGNEMDWTWYWDSDWNNPAAFVKFNKYVEYIRHYTFSKWGRKIPVTSAVINYPVDWTIQYQLFDIDIFSINIFWTNFGQTFTGDGGSFAGMTKLACQFNKPLLMTEVGVPGYAYGPGNFNTIWYNVLQNIGNGLIGAVYFEQTDEPALNKDWGLWSLQAAVLPDGTTSTGADVFVADTVVAKQQFTDVVSGTYNGVQYNMNADVFSLLGRAPYTPTTAPDYCQQTVNANFLQCPGTGTAKCSGNGACDRIAGTCACGVGWTGVDCSVAVCPGGCSGHGRCSTYISPPECYCDSGYYGPFCNETTASVPAGQCPGGCSNGNGVCNNSVCSCIKDWTGPDCAVTYVGKGDLNIAQDYLQCDALSSNYASYIPLVGAVLANLSVVTNHNCRYYCGYRGFTFAATIGGSQCYCLNYDLRSTSSGSTPAACSSPCTGDSTQNCGGPLGASVYLAAAPTEGTTVCSAVPENSAVTLSCPAGKTITNILYVSYGTPTGACGNFQSGKCDASTALPVVQNLCLNQPSCSFSASNGVFGDPCWMTLKNFAAQVVCS